MNIPDKLYRYISFHHNEAECNRRLNQLFIETKFHFTSPQKFNDPYDCNSLISFKDASNDDIDRFLENLITHMRFKSVADKIAAKYDMFSHLRYNDEAAQGLKQNGLGRALCQMNEEFGIFSLSEKKNDIVMWSHYAESHTGVCLELDCREINSLDGYGITTLPIHYQPDYPTLHDYLSRNDLEIIKMFLTTKSSHWEHESEWRIIADNTHLKRDITFAPSILTGIIFGVKTLEGRKEQICHLIMDRHPKPQLYQATLNHDEYKLDIQEIAS